MCTVYLRRKSRETAFSESLSTGLVPWLALQAARAPRGGAIAHSTRRAVVLPEGQRKSRLHALPRPYRSVLLSVLWNRYAFAFKTCLPIRGRQQSSEPSVASRRAWKVDEDWIPRPMLINVHEGTPAAG